MARTVNKTPKRMLRMIIRNIVMTVEKTVAVKEEGGQLYSVTFFAS
jgi:hypothetical protein